MHRGVGVVQADSVEKGVVMKVSKIARRVLVFVRRFTQRHGFPPSTREIAAEFGWADHSTARYHLTRLVDAGLVTRLPKPRCIRVKERA